jgi:hypothetical protein
MIFPIPSFSLSLSQIGGDGSICLASERTLRLTDRTSRIFSEIRERERIGRL